MSDNNTKLIQEALDGYELHGSSDNAAVSQGWITAAHLAHALDAADNQLRDLSNLIWDYDEWEPLAGVNAPEPAISIYKLRQVMTEPHA